MNPDENSLCPCNSGKTLANCCAIYHTGEAAPTAEALMRSRYSAFALGLSDYIWQTWHPDTRPDISLIGGLNLKWIQLTICDTQAGGLQDEQGKVRFIASYVANRKGYNLEESSNFVKEGGLWLYVDGKIQVREIQRNEPCPCGSGLKFKRCCLE